MATEARFRRADRRGRLLRVGTLSPDHLIEPKELMGDVVRGKVELSMNPQEYLTGVLPDDDEARFARAVCARSGVSEFPLHHIGSGFTFLAGDVICLLTARHTIENNQADPLGIALPPVDGSTVWWASDACVHLEAEEQYKDDHTYADLALYSMDSPPRVRQCLNERDFATIPKGLRMPERTPLVAYGYPHNDAEFDIEGHRLIGGRIEMDGTYGGLSSFRGLAIFESKHLNSNEPNGMSGGPIMVRMPDGAYVLAGIIVQGSSSSGRLYFVTAEWIIGALNYGLPLLYETRLKFHGDKMDKYE